MSSGGRCEMTLIKLNWPRQCFSQGVSPWVAGHPEVDGYRMWRLAPERRAYIGARRWSKFEGRRRDRTMRLIRIPRDDAVAIRLEHFRAFQQQVLIDSNIELLEHAF